MPLLTPWLYSHTCAGSWLVSRLTTACTPVR